MTQKKNHFRALRQGLHIPVQWIVLHAKVVSGKVPRWVTQIVVLVPQHSLTPRGCCYNLHLDGKFDCGSQLTTHFRLQQTREPNSKKASRVAVLKRGEPQLKAVYNVKQWLQLSCQGLFRSLIWQFIH